MKIRRLEIQGFKSFADRTSFDFGDGISSIVGPNGCGKSNVVDAIKWVLGDMSPKSLRGRKMEDVIFAGSRHRRPLPLAEVTLTLENLEGVLETERREVTITRRLDRAGTSEYLLCGEKARLKDIRELFFDTGLGVEGNAIMEQGRIDAILAANPQDRRGIFEEAAGVSRYKQRRKEAEQRLQRTHENLERLLDVLELEEKRLRSLKNQAGRARRYQELRGEFAKKRVLRAVLRYRTIREERDAIQARLVDATQREEAASEELSLLEARTRESEAERKEALQGVHAEEGRIAEALSDVRAAGERIEGLDRARQELGTRQDAARAEAVQARDRTVLLEGERARLLEDVAASEERTESHLALLEEAEIECRRLDGEVQRIRDVHDATKREVLRLLGRLSEARNAEAARRADVRQTEERIARVRRHQGDVERRLGRLEEELDQLAREAERLEAEGTKHAEALREATGRRTEISRRLSDGRSRRAALAQDRATRGGRLELLERLAQSGEGLAEGARAVREDVADLAPDADGARDGVLGVLADLVRPVPEAAAQLDRLLGHAAGAIVVRTTADALRWLQWLRDQKDGARARFLSLDLVRPASPALPEALGDLGIGPDLLALVRSVAGGTELVPDLETGITRWRESATNAVTPLGDRVTASGALLGGADAETVGLVERSAERRQLVGEVGRLDEALRDADADLAAQEAELEALEDGIDRCRDEIARHAEHRSRGGEALERVGHERARALDEIRVLRQEIEDLVAELADADEWAAVAGRRAAALGEERRALEERAEEAARGYVTAEGARHEASERRMEVRLALAETRAKRDAARTRSERSREEALALRERAAALDQEAEDLTLRIREAEVEIEEARARIRRREEDRRTAADRLVEARDRLEALERAAGGEAERRREVHALYEALRREVEAYRLKDSELRARIESLVEQVRLDQALELAEVDADTASTTDLDIELVSREVEELRQRLESLGNVNLNAIQELEEVQQHVDFLTSQRTDLLEAKADLETVIQELDRISTSRFAETFEQVREHFRETFRRLFGGGRADIVLEDASNVLESGIDIVARPPGKEQRTISLLSGGERTLTAVALLFAVFKAKPSPFAILDEVDAALDEANVRRMIGMVREFTGRSQFLVVTHAKTTMEAADLLYGVTMEEPGVSKRVAVRLSEYAKETSEAVAAG